jgi:hypothetical protein
MAGKTDEEIAEARDRAHAKLRKNGLRLRGSYVVVTAVAIPTLSAPKYRRLCSATKTQSAALMRRSKKSPT